MCTRIKAEETGNKVLSVCLVWKNKQKSFILTLVECTLWHLLWTKTGHLITFEKSNPLYSPLIKTHKPLKTWRLDVCTVQLLWHTHNSWQKCGMKDRNSRTIGLTKSLYTLMKISRLLYCISNSYIIVFQLNVYSIVVTSILKHLCKNCGSLRWFVACGLIHHSVLTMLKTGLKVQNILEQNIVSNLYFITYWHTHRQKISSQITVNFEIAFCVAILTCSWCL